MFVAVNDIDIASNADDKRPYMIADNWDNLIISLDQTSNGLFEWFGINLSKINADKCHLLVSTNDKVNKWQSKIDLNEFKWV